jgi:hypothetical protein
MRSKLLERIVVDVVDDILQIDGVGQVWRIKEPRYDKHSMCLWYVPIVPWRRAEQKVKNGYLRVSLRINHKSYQVLAHRLVWQYFYGDIPEELEINHLNGVKDDNRLDNLEIVTTSENNKHGYRIGVKVPFRGEEAPWAKLTEHQARTIKALAQRGRFSQRRIGERYGVHKATVSDILCGRRWQHLAAVTSDEFRKWRQANDPS